MLLTFISNKSCGISKTHQQISTATDWLFSLSLLRGATYQGSDIKKPNVFGTRFAVRLQKETRASIQPEMLYSSEMLPFVCVDGGG